MTVSLKSGVRVTADLERRYLQMRVLYEAINAVVELLQKFELSRFLVKTREPDEWKSVPLLVS